MNRLSSYGGILLSILCAALSVEAAPAAARSRSHRPRSVRSAPLVYQAEMLDGGEVGSDGADEEINPASVVKVATSMWALENLGPDFRWETRFVARGTVGTEEGTLDGDLVVQGGGDPDFQSENAFLVAAALNRAGLRTVTGALKVDKDFWIGWENGSEGTLSDPLKRGLRMAERLRRALDSRRWSAGMRREWEECAIRRGLDPRRPPRVRVLGGVGMTADAGSGSLLLVHRSKPLLDVLHRFDTYSNNDIERLGLLLGSADALAAHLTSRLDDLSGGIHLDTLSGLGTNRLTPRLVVRLLRAFRETCRRHGLEVADVLPVAGCGPGTVTRFFPKLAHGDAATAVVAKTGTLTSTDGGVTVLAGFANTSEGEIAFCVASPRAGRHLAYARRSEERWVLQLIASHGGPRPRPCTATLALPTDGAALILATDTVVANRPGTGAVPGSGGSQE